MERENGHTRRSDRRAIPKTAHKRIGVCGECGAGTWDGKCASCVRLAVERADARVALRGLRADVRIALEAYPGGPLADELAAALERWQP